MTPEYRVALTKAAEVISAGRQPTSTPEERREADRFVLELKILILTAAVVDLERANKVLRERNRARQSNRDLEALRSNPDLLEVDTRLTKLIEECE